MPSSMGGFSGEYWAVFGLIAGAAVLVMLHVAATAFGRVRQAHDLRVRVFELRRAYSQRLADLAAEEAQDGRVTEAQAHRFAMQAAADAVHTVNEKRAA
jgi:hypothetical protein